MNKGQKTLQEQKVIVPYLFLYFTVNFRMLYRSHGLQVCSVTSIALNVSRKKLCDDGWAEVLFVTLTKYNGSTVIELWRNSRASIWNVCKDVYLIGWHWLLSELQVHTDEQHVMLQLGHVLHHQNNNVRCMSNCFFFACSRYG